MSGAPVSAGRGARARVEHGRYTEMEYLQFRSVPALDALRRACGVLTWPLVVPLALLARLSDALFRTASEALALVPYLFGVILRAEFYRLTLTSCGRNLVTELGTVFVYRDVRVGNHVLLGRYTTVHHCDIDDYVLVAEGVSLLSGARYHSYGRTDLPMALQGGRKTRICVGPDCWIGAKAAVMADVAKGAIVGAGAIVTRPVAAYAIVAGNPARPIGSRLEGEGARPKSQGSQPVDPPSEGPASAGRT